MSGFALKRLGMIMEPKAGEPNEVEGVLNPAAARGRDGQLYLFPRLVARGNYSRIGIARVLFDRAGDPTGVERMGVVLEPEADYELSETGGGCEDPRISFVDDCPGTRQQVPRVFQEAADANCLKQLEGGAVDGFHLVIRDEAGGRQGIDQLPPWHLRDVGGAAAAMGCLRPHARSAEAFQALIQRLVDGQPFLREALDIGLAPRIGKSCALLRGDGLRQRCNLL